MSTTGRAGEYDAIFVGAGINALAAAYVLSLAGRSVLVLDRNPQPGGCIHTGAFTRPGFQHDFGAMNLGQLVGSSFFALHGAALRAQGVVVLAATRAYSSIFPDGRLEARRFFYVHVNSRLDQLQRTWEEAAAGLLPASPLLVVGQPTVFDPTRAPANRHTLWVMVRAVPAHMRGDAAGRLRGARWAELREAYADRVLDHLEEHAPGFRRTVLERVVLSPDDIEAVNPSLVGGNLIAGSHHLEQWYDRRPFPGYAHYALPVEGLYMVGASTWPGAGAGPASGMLLARRLLA